MKRKRIRGKHRGGNRYLYMNAGILNERQLIVSLQVKKTDTLRQTIRGGFAYLEKLFLRKQDHL